MNPDLYFDSKTRKYFYTGPPACSRCTDDLSSNAVYVTFHPKKYRSYRKVYCHHCLQTIKKQNDVLYAAEIRKVLVSDMLPDTAYPIPLRRLYLGRKYDLSGILTTWAAQSDTGIKSDTSSTIIKDHTRLAGVESFEGAQIGMSPEKVPLDNNMLDESSMKSLLIDLKHSKPSENKLLIDHRRNS